MYRTLLLLPVLAILSLNNAVAEDIPWDEADDPPIFVSSPSCPLFPGCAVYGFQVNGIHGNTFTLTQALGGPTFGAADPLMLLIGVPNVAGSYAAPAISLSTGVGVLGGAAPAGLTPWNTTTGFAGTMTAGGPITNAYQAIGVADAWLNFLNQGATFAIWAAADAAVLGLSVSNFGVYAYQLTKGPVDQNGVLTGFGSNLDVTFASSLAKGTFVTAYGCHTSVFPCSGKDVFSTPFAFTGLALDGPTNGRVSVPEPSILSQMGLDLFGLAALAGVLARSRFKRVRI